MKPKVRFYDKIPLDFLSDKALLIGIVVIAVSFSFTVGYLVGKSQSRVVVKQVSEKLKAVQDRAGLPEEVKEPSTGSVSSEPEPEGQRLETEETVHLPPEVQQEAKGVKEEAEKVELESESPAHERYYTIQVGAFRVRSEAERLEASLRQKGYPVRVEQSEKKKIYRVRVGVFKDKSSAQQMAIKITRNEGLKTIVIREDGK